MTVRTVKDKKLAKKDASRLFEIELIGLGESPASFEGNPLTFVSDTEFTEYLNIWAKYLNKPEYEWVEKGLRSKLHNFGRGIYYELEKGKYRLVHR